MIRVQIYLDSNHLNILDLLAAQTGTSRSQIIRKAVEAEGKKVTKTKKLQKNPLLAMAGFIKDGPKDLASNVDEIYTRKYHQRKGLY